MHIPLCNMEVPGNAFTYFMVLFSVTSYDLLPTNEMYPESSNSLQENFYNLGYESIDFIHNLGTPLLFMLLLVPFLPLIFCCKICNCLSKFKALDNKLQKLSLTYFWSVPIRFIYENATVIIVSCLIQFSDLRWESLF